LRAFISTVLDAGQAVSVNGPACMDCCRPWVEFVVTKLSNYSDLEQGGASLGKRNICDFSFGKNEHFETRQPFSNHIFKYINRSKIHV